uniref:C-CAP/cofactor C-like domain-containing protein n=1 Tax=Leptocylindrus danicus TaxID=163516 RepID=A0A7S2JQX8_9STRA|mmetsp:Transcript_10528/g.15806  ORF Transcript_10528/g.15806 Transcript_10528/m.15806 type:complete len:492 (+) Transcript_10528:96-1571(+)
MSNNEADKITSLLNTILTRLDDIETKIGTAAPASATDANLEADVTVTEASPAVTGYEEHMSTALEPFLATLASLNGEKMGECIREAWVAIGAIIAAASTSKKPAEVTTALMPFLKPVQDSVGKIRKMRLPRELDHHQRSIEELMGVLSWVVIDKTPVPAIKDTVGAAEYYSNKIRREYKGKNETQIAFCDQLKALILHLADYVKQYHLTGLSFNPNGGAFPTSVDAPKAVAVAVAVETPKPAPAPAVASGGINAIMVELNAKKTSSGDSAATGLKKVTKDMQTWRDEYKGDNSASTTVAAAPKAKAAPIPKAATTAAKKSYPPVCKFVDVGAKWVVEYQTKTSNTFEGKSALTIEMADPKHQAYIYKCENITIDVKGKCKGLVIDGCKRVNVLFDNVISVVELVNNKNIAVQTRGVLPSVSIDKTDGCMVYLSKASVGVTNFVTSKSSEMNVSWPEEGADGEEYKEKPIPEQFLHKLVDGAITSEVSELYS